MYIHEKKITTIISDLDGTLLGEKKELDPVLFSVIGELKRNGVEFVAASGRQYKNMRLMFEPIAEGLPFICENGSLVVKNDKTLYVECIPKELAFELLEDMASIPGTETIVSSDRELYTLACRESFIRYMRDLFKPEIMTVEDYREIPGEFNKLSIWWPEGIPEALCFGDSENDIPMFRECALSFAMERSRSHVKTAADAVCGNVGDMLREFLANAE